MIRYKWRILLGMVGLLASVFLLLWRMPNPSPTIISTRTRDVPTQSHAALPASVPTVTEITIEAGSAVTPSVQLTNPTPSPTQSLQPTLNFPILSPVGLSAATNLQSRADCTIEDPGKGIVVLSWSLATNPGDGQRVDVTTAGFEGGEYESSSLLPPDQISLVWDRLSGQAIHEWRILTKQADGWVPSETASFVGPTCVVNFEPDMVGQDRAEEVNVERRILQNRWITQ